MQQPSAADIPRLTRATNSTTIRLASLRWLSIHRPDHNRARAFEIAIHRTEVNVTSPTCLVEIAQQTGESPAKPPLDTFARLGRPPPDR